MWVRYDDPPGTFLCRRDGGIHHIRKSERLKDAPGSCSDPLRLGVAEEAMRNRFGQRATMNASTTTYEGDGLSPMAQVIKDGIVGLDGPWIIGSQITMLYAARSVPGNTVHGAHSCSQAPGHPPRADHYLLLHLQRRRAVHALVRGIHSVAERASAFSSTAVGPDRGGVPVSGPGRWLLQRGAWG
jgi:hypothetical protein